MTTSDRFECNGCGGSVPLWINKPPQLQGVTSDGKSWPRSGRIGACGSCGHVQKLRDEQFHQDAKAIYDAYDIYRVSGGAEQPTFDGGQAVPRSARLLERFTSAVRVPRDASLLDVGCGNGALLKAARNAKPYWSLAGVDQDDRHRESIERIPRILSFRAGPLDEIAETYHIVTLIHVLEHVADPVEFLGGLRRNLKPGGYILVQVPNVSENPFDLLVADHCSHFEPSSLKSAAQRAGFTIVRCTTDWISKEISLVLRDGSHSAWSGSTAENRPELFFQVQKQCWWLAALVEQARSIAATGRMGVFGTATAGTWIAGLIGPLVSYFVDEDVARIGRTHLGKPIRAVQSLRPGSRVHLTLPPQVARAVLDRLEIQFPSVEFLAPPELDEKFSKVV